MSAKRRVMLLICQGDLGGGPETVRQLAAYLPTDQFDLSVVCPADSNLMDALAAIPNLKRFGLSFLPILSLRTVRQLAQLIRQEKIEILHTHLLLADIYGFLVTKICPVPRLVSTIQGPNFFWEMERGLRRARWRIYSRWYRWIYRSFDGIAACSGAVKEAVSHRPGIRVPEDKMFVIHNSADLRRIRAHERGGRGSNPSAPPQLITVANFDRFKGHEVLLRALRLLKPEINVQCLWIGEGIERSRLEAQAAAWDLTDRVQFLGARPDVPDLLQTSDFFVFPSLWEPFGIAVLEAMASGTPIIACRAGGIPEIISHGKTGLLVPPGDPEALAHAVRYLLSHPAAAQNLASAAHKAVVAFDAPLMAKRYAAWYQSLVK